MIDPHCLTPEWLTEKRTKHTKADPSIMEKVVRALYLLQQLQQTKLPFVFKGGTSLLLILPEPARFSVDIDIIVPPELKQADVEPFLEKIKGDVFKSVKLDAKRSYVDKIPKAHYQFEYESALSKNRPGEILLDILFEKNHYPTSVEMPLTCEWVKLSGTPLNIMMPDVNSITGDKLTAFAPNTIGIQYGIEKEREIIKQLFDVGMLFDRITDLETFKTSFRQIAVIELSYREQSVNEINQVLDDIIDTALVLAKRNNQTSDIDNAKFAELQTGINQFGPFVYTGSFRIDDAITASSKAALLAAIIKKDFKGTLPKFDQTAPLSSYLIQNPEYMYLNRKLKNIRGGALFYWSETLKLLHSEPATA